MRFRLGCRGARCGRGWPRGCGVGHEVDHENRKRPLAQRRGRRAGDSRHGRGQKIHWPDRVLDRSSGMRVGHRGPGHARGTERIVKRHACDPDLECRHAELGEPLPRPGDWRRDTAGLVVDDEIPPVAWAGLALYVVGWVAFGLLLLAGCYGFLYWAAGQIG